MSKTVDDAMRIRDNQRRSRARRKDLIKELQARVQEYESKGVTATQEMQRAARKVAQENERLRLLLARHGILKEEINAFLRSAEQAEGSSEPETASSSAKSSSVTNPYPNHTGPRSLSIQPLSQAYPQNYSPRPSPISPRPPIQIQRQPKQMLRQPVQASAATRNCVPATQGWLTSKTPTEMQVEATTMAGTIEAGRKVEANYASPSDTSSSPASLSREAIPAFTFSEHTPAITSSQGCCPPTKPQREITMEDQECPSTVDCFCPPTTTAPLATSRPVIGTDEISCETAATIIAQMRGDGDEAAARASIGCAPQQVCRIKNAFLMQVLDEG